MITSRIAAVPTIALTAAALAACGSDSSSPGASESKAAANASSVISGSPVPGADLAVLVSDRTFTGTENEASYTEYYAPDGTLRGIQDDEEYSGTWSVQGNEICFTYSNSTVTGTSDGASPGASTAIPSDAVPTETAANDCFEPTSNGTTVYWYQGDDLTGTSTYVQGNPNNL